MGTSRIDAHRIKVLEGEVKELWETLSRVNQRLVDIETPTPVEVWLGSRPDDVPNPVIDAEPLNQEVRKGPGGKWFIFNENKIVSKGFSDEAVAIEAMNGTSE